VIIRDGASLEAPIVSGPVAMGSILLLQIKPTTGGQNIGVERCQALEDQPSNKE
jgi:hypothetical protein